MTYFSKLRGSGAPRGPSPVGAGVNLCTYVCVCFREEAETQTHTHTHGESLSSDKSRVIPAEWNLFPLMATWCAKLLVAARVGLLRHVTVTTTTTTSSSTAATACHPHQCVLRVSPFAPRCAQDNGSLRSALGAGYCCCCCCYCCYCALRRLKSVQMNRRPPGTSGVQWLNRRDMSVRAEDSITLCQRAFQIVTELCLTGHVDREKCAGIFPLDSTIPGIGHAGFGHAGKTTFIF